MISEFGAMRRLAVNRYLSGDKISRICQDLDMSRKWFYKWKKRYLSGEEGWHLDESRARKTTSLVLDLNTEEKIIRIRKNLEKTKYAQIGALTIMYELKKIGFNRIPTIQQINRTLKRYGLVKPNGPYRPKNRPYPKIEVKKPGVKQDMDFTPSYTIKGCGSIRGLNLIDEYSGKAKVNICRTRKSGELINSLIDTWKVIGVPQYLQMDNDPAFSSHNMRPRNLSRVIRFLLSLDIELVYIPEYEPWRNGVIEKFNDFYKKFYYLDRWKNIDDLIRGAKIFETFHNNNHRYSTRRSKTPIELEEEANYVPNLLPLDFRIKENEPIPLKNKGKIHFIRYIRSNRVLTIFNEKFYVHDDLVYNYAKVTIDIDRRLLEIRLNDEIVETREYKLNV